MTSTVILYEDCKIIPEKNFLVDDLNEYLSTLTSTTLQKFQYQKHKYDLSIKINMNQSETNFNNHINYVSIQNEDGRKVYYFVINKRWTAEDTVFFDLLMDTVNTFTIGVDYDLSNKTRIEREHFDRFTYKRIKETALQGEIGSFDPSTYDGKYYHFRQSYGYGYVLGPIKDFHISGLSAHLWINYTWDAVNKVLDIDLYTDDVQERYDIEFYLEYYEGVKRKIDRYSEGIQANKYKTEMKKITDKLDMGWNLVYRNENDIEPTEYNQENPVDTFLVPDSNVEVRTAQEGTSFSIDLSTFVNGFYIFSYKYPSGWVSFQTIYDGKNNYYNLEEESYGYYVLVIQVNSGSYDAQMLLCDSSNKVIQVSQILAIENLVYIYPSQQLIYYALNAVRPGLNDTIPAHNNSIDSNLYTGVQLVSAKSLDRTDPKLIKVIKIPYFPGTITTTGTSLNLSSGWQVALTGPQQHMLKLENKDEQFKNYITVSDIKPFDPLKDLSEEMETITPNDNRNIKWESKLYHSDYYQPTMVYDSFAKAFNLEMMDVTNTSYESDFQVTFQMTKTINSRFMFTFPQYNLYYSNENFDNILYVARNNEEVIYTSQYITYLRTGYNYDVKSKQLRNQQTAIGTAGRAIGSIGSIIAGAASGNAFFVAVGALSLISSIASGINSVQQNEVAFEKNLNALQNQAVSVYGADDVDLMVAYSDNRLWYALYEISPRLKGMMYDLFYYTGYISGRMDTPTMNNRTYFDYCLCEAVLENDEKLPDFVKSDIVERFKGGITRLHHYNNTWDFEQEKENWENLFNGGIVYED